MQTERTVFYATTTMCPRCEKLMPGEVVGDARGVFIARDCPEHGHLEGLVCSDRAWWDSLARFDVAPQRPRAPQQTTVKGCPEDCGLCPAHRQSAGTTAIEISNACNSTCPVCLADNRGTFSMTPAEVRDVVARTIRDQGPLDVVTLSGGEPTIHPQLFEILDALAPLGVGRIVVNTNGLRVAEDDAFVARLREHGVYLSLHYDGQGARALRGIDPAVQERALARATAAGIGVVPLLLAARGVNEDQLGDLALGLLARPQVKSLILSLMAYTGSRGGRYPVDPMTRLTIPAALEAIEAGSGGRMRKRDFMPLPMPNPVCAAVGYFLVDDEGVLPLLPAAGVDRMIDCIKNQHFAKADARFEAFFRETIDRVFAEGAPGAADTLRRCKRFLARLFPEAHPVTPAARAALAEEGIKTVYLMQFMDGWTFDAKRLAKCSCQHLLPAGKTIPSCGYYAYHRRFDARFQPSA
jgi:7,8-dihydro-6-hydroxymethylpterin dimethyltransferase